MTSYPQGLSPEAFIDWESHQESKHEYVGGQISAFPGVSQAHGTLVLEIAMRLVTHLRGTRCRVFASDLLTATERSLRYPDVVVTGDPRDLVDPQSRKVEHPKLIIEVLSQSTERIDRGPKFAEYRSIDTLEEYALIDSRRRSAEAHRRTAGGWVRSLPVTSGRFELVSVELALDLDELYAEAGL